MDRKKIVETYMRLEKQNGGIGAVCPRFIVELTAKELGIDYADARSVMVDQWVMGGAG